MRKLNTRILMLLVVPIIALMLAACSSGGSSKEGEPIQKGDYETTPGGGSQPK